MFFKKIIEKIKKLFSKKFNIFSIDSIVNYIFSAESLPAPLPTDKECELVKRFQDYKDERAKAELIEHNLRLVMYIAKRFESKKLDMQDLVSVGAIGLIKAVDSYKLDKNIKLATYASRCIENEILMYFRSNNKYSKDISINEAEGFDKDGNEIAIQDVLKSPRPDFVEDINIKDNILLLKKYMKVLLPRERDILVRSYGLDNQYEET